MEEASAGWWLFWRVTLVTVSVGNFKMGFNLQPLNCEILEKILCLSNSHAPRGFHFPERNEHVCGPICVCARVWNLVCVCVCVCVCVDPCECVHMSVDPCVSVCA